MAPLADRIKDLRPTEPGGLRPSLIPPASGARTSRGTCEGKCCRRRAAGSPTTYLPHPAFCPWLDTTGSATHVRHMSKMIQIRNVPDDVHRALAERAEREGMSLSGFLLREVTKVAERPSLAEIIARAEQRKPLKPVTESSVEILRELRGH